MNPKDYSRPSINPRRLVESEGIDALAEILAGVGYVIQRQLLIDLEHSICNSKPLLIEGPRGGGKTSMAKALAKGCNLTTFYLQGMDYGVNLDQARADLLYSWDRESQSQMVRQALEAGVPLEEAQGQQFTRKFLLLGEALGAFDYAASHQDIPVFILDEADKLNEKTEDMLLQLLGEGWAHVPRYGDVGVPDPDRWPIVILLSNNFRHDLSPMLRSRCLYTWLDPPTPREEVRILRASAPMASRELLACIAKLINCVRRDMSAVLDKPGLRESIDLIKALTKRRVTTLTSDVIRKHLCFLAKQHKDLLNMRRGIARLEFSAHMPDHEIDEWVAWAFEDNACVLEESA
jgi:MoxR-like ATPase